MVPHFFPGMPLPGWDVSMVGAHMVSWECPPRTGHPKTYPLEAAGAGLLPRGCVVAVPILQGHTLKGDGRIPTQEKASPLKKMKLQKKPSSTTPPPDSSTLKRSSFYPQKSQSQNDIQPPKKSIPTKQSAPQKANPKIVRPP